jgi:hypothetical protein
MSSSLLQVKHGQKVLAKLQKTFPNIFGLQANNFNNYETQS